MRFHQYATRIAVLLVVGVALAVIPVSAVHAKVAHPQIDQSYTASGVWEEPEGVAAHFPVPDVDYTTPGFAKDEQFTTHEEMMEFIYDLREQTDRMKVRIIGYSGEGRPIPLLIFSKPSYVAPADVVGLNKPVVWLQGQQHGNEPAAGEAMLVMARQLAVGALGDRILEDVSVLVIPRVNPDGSYYFQRKPADQIDINRDHIKMVQPETRALHATFNAYHPDIVVDHHEFGPKEGDSYKVYNDMQLLSAKNLNVPEAVRDMADNLVLENAYKALGEQDLRSHWYWFGSVAKTNDENVIKEGGTISRIGRNAFGLKPSLSFLVESSGIGIGRQHFKRRVHGHVVTATSILETAAQNAAAIQAVVDEAKAEITEKGRTVDESDKVVVSMKRVEKKDTVPFIDYSEEGGCEVVDVDVTAMRSSFAEATLKRVRPYAYILPPTYEEIAEILHYEGVTVSELVEPVEVEVESYKVTESKRQDYIYEGVFRNSVKTEVSSKEVKFPQGSYVVYMAQPGANNAVMALEPEGSSSLVTYKILNVTKGDEVPVYRFMEEKDLPTTLVNF
ncbi:MAG: M14 family metallocarboxypeptidase [Synergistales bacterium]|nr:M14 family metallocarboxypeptidase [Synergistales bacterium]